MFAMKTDCFETEQISHRSLRLWRSSKNWWSLCPLEYCRVDKEAGCSGKQMQMRRLVGDFCVESAECRGQGVLGLWYWSMGIGCCDLGCWVQGVLSEDHLYGGIKVNYISSLSLSSFSFFISEFISLPSSNVSSPFISLCNLLPFSFPPSGGCFHIIVSEYLILCRVLLLKYPLFHFPSYLPSKLIFTGVV